MFKKEKTINNKLYRCGAVVVAAGSGKRMGEEINKVFLEIDGIPILAHSIMPLNNCSLIDEIVLVARECDIPDCYRIAKDFNLNKIKAIVPGGDERQDSVYSGVCAMQDDTQFVAIHDGARPFASPSLIDEVINCAIKTKAAILAVPCKDTVKIVDNNGLVSNTPDRSKIWLAQTPQVFERGILNRAFEYIKNNNIKVTDDCQMIELLGESVHIIMGSYDNIKITTPEDLDLALCILDKMT